MTDNYKQYTNSARRGIKGEAFFETLIVDHAIPHRIARQNDLGVDFLCEWICGDRPTGIVFLAQVKSRTTKDIKPKQEALSNDKNGLESYTLVGAEDVDDDTISYWKGLALPAFLFYVVEDILTQQLNCFYKRYTPFIDGFADEDYRIGSRSFYKANIKESFRAFADTDRQLGGFARDLIIDYVRLWYSKGHLVRLVPSELGFWPLPHDPKHLDTPVFFTEFIKWNRSELQRTALVIASLLEQIPE
jgi:Domain of unknown function (DUF4365)